MKEDTIVHIEALEQHEDPLFHTIRETLRKYDSSGTHYKEGVFPIPRVPPSIWNTDPLNAYEPQLISIGPYHRRTTKFDDMQDCKWWYMYKLLQRTTTTTGETFDGLLERCIDEVKQAEVRARTHYKEKYINRIDSGDFVTMLVLDGCFIVELLVALREDDCGANEPIRVPWMSACICIDLLKLENQIPYFILEALFNIVQEENSLELLATHFIGNLLSLPDSALPREKIHHLLHLGHILLRPQSVDCGNTSTNNQRCPFPKSLLKKMKAYTMPSSATQKTSEFRIPCAVELREAGISFISTKKEDKQSILNVSFKDGVLHFPSLTFQDSTNPIFRNLLAFEQLYPNESRYFSAYIYFLDCLVNTSRDVTLLQLHGVIENLLGSEDELAQMINQLGKDVTVDEDHYLTEVFSDVNEYCQSKCNKHRAKCMHDYFNSPWSMISVIAAVALLLMTFLQLLLAGLSYEKQ